MVCLSALQGYGQMTFTSGTGLVQKQNFDAAMAGNVTTLPSGFQIGGSSTVGHVAASLASNSTGGTYSYYYGTDYAIGILNSGTFGNTSITLQLSNNTSLPITKFDVAFNYEKYRIGSRQWTFTLSGTPGSGSGPTGTITATTGTNPTIYPADGGSNNITYFPPQQIAEVISITGLNIPNGGTYTLTWSLVGNGGTSNGQALAIDDLIITAHNPKLSSSTLSDFGTICTNSTGGPNSFTITGTDLTNANVTVAALPGFTYSTSSNGTYSSSLSLAQSGGAYSQNIFVKFNPTAVQAYDGNIALGGGGTTSSINVAATGSGTPTASITATAGTNGSISSSGVTAINCGTNQHYDITPDACYKVSDVLVDGLSVGAVTSYDFTNVIIPHTITASFSLITYSYTATAGTNGSISSSGVSSVNCGANKHYDITPNSCYQIADVLVDGVSVGAVTSYDFTNASTAHSISASFAIISYPITATVPAGNGAISSSGVTNVNCGTAQHYDFTPNTCFQVADVLVDGVSVGAVNSYDFTNVISAHDIQVSFTLSNYSITASAGTNGSISSPGATSIVCGNNQHYDITPDPCYQIADVVIDGVSVGAVTSYDFTSIMTAHTIVASFSQITYSFTATAGTNGSISSNGVTSVNCGTTQHYDITPDACYQIVDVLVDGVSVGAVNSYDFTNVSAAHTIEASFSQITYSVTANAGTNGSISSSGITTANCGTTQHYDITPDACFQVADVLVDNVSVGAVNSYDFTNISAAHTIVASFSQITYSFAATAGTNGSISSPGSSSVVCGNNQHYDITPDACYQIADVVVDGISVGAVSSYDFTSVNAAHTIVASFSQITYSFTATAGTNGSISSSSVTSVNCGTTQHYDITPDACYQIADVLVDGVSIGAVNSYDFTSVNSNHTISATFSASTVNATISIAADPGNTVCSGSSVTFTATPTNEGSTPSYQWVVNGNNVGSNSSTATYTSSSFANNDVVSCVLTSNASCVSSSTVNSNSVTLTVNSTVSTVTKTGSTLTADQTGVTYQWVDCSNSNSPISGATSISFTPTTSGNYAVTITKNSCSVTSTCTNVVITGINNSDFGNSFEFYPNPTTGRVKVNLDKQYTSLDVKITHVTGSIIEERNVSGDSFEIELTGDAGMYYVALTDVNGQTKVLKLIKQF